MVPAPPERNNTNGRDRESMRGRRLVGLNLWSTGRELNPRILVLQTSALAASPPVPEKQRSL
jgi:hypothetical protein